MRVLLPVTICEQPGWLSPRGSFYPCAYGEHCEVASALCARLGMPAGGEDHLERLGWIPLRETGPGVGMHTTLHPTRQQREALWHLLRIAHNETVKFTVKSYLDMIDENEGWTKHDH